MSLTIEQKNLAIEIYLKTKNAGQKLSSYDLKERVAERLLLTPVPAEKIEAALLHPSSSLVSHLISISRDSAVAFATREIRSNSDYINSNDFAPIIKAIDAANEVINGDSENK